MKFTQFFKKITKARFLMKILETIERILINISFKNRKR
jgi:hypothetical protein